MKIFKPWFIPLAIFVFVKFNHGEARTLINATKRAEGAQKNEITIGKRFENMCIPQLASFKDRNWDRPDLTLPKQFAVLWIGDQQYRSMRVFGINTFEVEGNYYAAATTPDQPPAKDQTNPPSRAPQTEHSEQIVLRKAQSILQEYIKQRQNSKPKVYLYTRNKPCCYYKGDNEPDTDDDENCSGSCSAAIKQWAKDNKDSIESLTITWDYPFNIGGDRKFLYGLAKLVESPETESSKVKIHFKESGSCRGPFPSQWFQKRLHQCAIEKLKKQRIGGCTLKALKRDLAKLINRVLWRCGTRKQSVSFEAKFGRKEDCWSEKMHMIMLGTSAGRLAGPKLMIHREVIECLKARKKGIEFLGPAISPDDPEKASSLASEIKGNDGTDKELCFA